MKLIPSLLLAGCLTISAVSQDPAPPAALRPPVKRIRQWSKVTARELVHSVPPSFGQLEPGTKLQGTVRLHAIIAEDGSVMQLEVISGHPLVIQPVMDAVKQWRYHPSLLNGEPVEVDTEIDVDYKIKIKK